MKYEGGERFSRGEVLSSGRFPLVEYSMKEVKGLLLVKHEAEKRFLLVKYEAGERFPSAEVC